jgi:hypothetical protein
MSELFMYAYRIKSQVFRCKMHGKINLITYEFKTEGVELKGAESCHKLLVRMICFMLLSLPVVCNNFRQKIQLQTLRDRTNGI